MTQRQLRINGSVVNLGARAFDVLQALAGRRGAVATKSELLGAAWPGLNVEENNLQAQISALRKALGADAIATVPGRGYQLTVAVVIADAPAQSAGPLLAVLPFANLSNDPEMDFFSEGISDEIIQRVTRGAKIKVIGRTSSFQFANKRADAARALKCTHVLDGSVRRAAGRARITAHLVEAASQTTVWSGTFDRNLEDIFAVQDEIAGELAAALNSAFSSVAAAPVDPATYDLFLRALRPDLVPERIVENIGLLEEVTKRAPHFADAWGKLAQRRAFLKHFVPYKHRPPVAALIQKEIGEARQRDPLNPAARMAEYLLLPPFGAFVEADEAVARIMRDTPSDAYGLITGAVHLQGVGRAREAVDLCERAYELNAFDPIIANFWGQCLFVVGEYEEARKRLEHTHALFPDVQGIAMFLMMLLAHQKDWTAVEALIEPARLAKFPLREFERTVRVVEAMREGGATAARRSADSARRRVEQTGRLSVNAIVYAAHLGAVDDVYDIVERGKFGPAGDERDTMGIHAYRTAILFYAPYPELRRDPRFAKLCARLGLVEYWLATGLWPDCAAELAPLYDFKAECTKHAQVPKDRFGV
jgi:TolB-like protein/Flp pilus assembly protein TadD